jgi:hypothetical protein
MIARLSRQQWSGESRGSVAASNQNRLSPEWSAIDASRLHKSLLLALG